jgi:hypothetical protein
LELKRILLGRTYLAGFGGIDFPLLGWLVSPESTKRRNDMTDRGPCPSCGTTIRNRYCTSCGRRSAPRRIAATFALGAVLLVGIVPGASAFKYKARHDCAAKKTVAAQEKCERKYG